MRFTWQLITCIFFAATIGCSPEKTSFEFVVLPDTQSYVEEHPEIYLKQMQWIARNKNRFSFVIHEGDITQNNSTGEWQIAKKGFNMLNGKVPYTFCLGNHDMGSVPGKFADVRNTEKANNFFKVEALKQNSNLLASFPSGTIDNLCSQFNIAGYKWFVFSLEFGPRNKTIAWANKIIKSHPDAKIIINTHAYLYEDSTWQDGEDWWQAQAYGVGKETGDNAVNNGKQLWNKLVAKHPNVIMVFCGHVLKSGVGTLVSTGENGNKVYQMLANYQKGVEGSKNGGDGFLRIVKMDIDNKRISVSTYSPWLDAYKKDADHDFTFKNVDFLN
ncbi:metallophosphoesterase [Galbibacter pacificus]|uniref:Metallophosphoesterase n=1 Tax=Galbibacter pacificus TaxID=2996052 RepID=A0ABT6FP08_9FLAO|nr:metallophosphoesterase [Galbibacter pacificus]MDG3581524.1 metallophosphoesterase [Galbibacter pacificus]MDG3585002.1 metallophosphoesterase [Galbibacter pacificus]